MRISAFFISILFFTGICTAVGQDTIPFPKKIKIGADLYGPGRYLTDKNILSIEGFFSMDLDTMRAAVIEAGWLDFKYAQYNYNYLSSGAFIRLGIDFNTIRPQASGGKYYAGIGLRYGLSIFRSETPLLWHENYWGTVSGSVQPATHMAHFLEASPGLRAELFRNFSIGWTIRLRLLLYSGTGKETKAIQIPGFGNGTKPVAASLNYYIVWSIPYKTEGGK
jgi:hypothetical protein